MLLKLKQKFRVKFLKTVRLHSQEKINNHCEYLSPISPAFIQIRSELVVGSEVLHFHST